MIEGPATNRVAKRSPVAIIAKPGYLPSASSIFSLRKEKEEGLAPLTRVPLRKNTGVLVRLSALAD